MKNLILATLLLLGAVFAAHAGQPNIVVDSVNTGSPAAAAGLQEDDYIVSLDGQEIVTHDDLKRVMAAHQPGDTVPLAVLRGDEIVNLSLTFGERTGGGVSIGVSLHIRQSADGTGETGDPGEGTEKCLAWIEKTYRITPLLENLGLEMSEDYETIRTCVGRDTRWMSEDNAVKYCDNVFKVHCSALDLLTEIGDAQVKRCEAGLSKSLGLQLKSDKIWTTCAQHKVFDRYMTTGVAGDEEACKAALLECRPDNEETLPPTETSAKRQAKISMPATWPQWGGPNQDFIAPAEDLATNWPESGPQKLWSRELGEGYSAILVEDGRLYTMHRVGDDEAVICLDAGSGKTVWEYRYESAPREGHVQGFGNGPRSTPLLAGDLLFTVGLAGKMHALNKNDGVVVWSRDLWDEELGGNVLGHGYASSPVAYKDTVIVTVGGTNAGLVAFNRKNGRVKWKALQFKNSYSSPRIVEIAGEQQIVVFMAEELIGVNPENGELRWRYPHTNQWHHNISMPAVVDGDTIFLSSLQTGAKGIRLVRVDGKIDVEEIWSTRRVQFYHGSSVRNGDWVYGSSGSASPAFMTAVNIRTGEIGWRERGFARANCVGADGKLVILDEDGMLYLAGVTPEKLIVHAKTQLLNNVAWTVPTIVGKILYVRDKVQIVAVNLG